MLWGWAWRRQDPTPTPFSHAPNWTSHRLLQGWQLNVCSDNAPFFFFFFFPPFSHLASPGNVGVQGCSVVWENCLCNSLHWKLYHQQYNTSCLSNDLLCRIIPKWRTIFIMRLKWPATSSRLDHSKCGLIQRIHYGVGGGVRIQILIQCWNKKEIKLPKTDKKQSKLKPPKCSVKVLFIIGFNLIWV